MLLWDICLPSLSMGSVAHETWTRKRTRHFMPTISLLPLSLQAQWLQGLLSMEPVGVKPHPSPALPNSHGHSLFALLLLSRPRKEVRGFPMLPYNAHSLPSGRRKWITLSLLDNNTKQGPSAYYSIFLFKRLIHLFES